MDIAIERCQQVRFVILVTEPVLLDLFDSPAPKDDIAAE